MRAAVYDRYGAADVVRIETLPVPAPAPHEVLVRVAATSVTTADWRQRASAFPGGLWLAGRLVSGVFRPRKRVLGAEFAGTVDAVGHQVTGFRKGDRVFGFAGHGAHAEYLAIAENAAVAPIPDGLTFQDAAALPFGAVSALVFLREVARISKGQRVMVIGASGNVGVYAVQIAKVMGAVVTGVASGANLGLVSRLGAEDVIDYRKTDPVAGDSRYDVIFDTVGALSFSRAAGALRQGGVFVPLNFSLLDVARSLWSKVRGGKSMRVAVSDDTRADLDAIAQMVRDGTLAPVIERVMPLDAIREAYRHVETRHRRGSVILDVAPATSEAEVSRSQTSARA